ncbi:hypothetical protein MUK42_36590 [Musa troglodytarum]|uniref:Uncharacterized protein n=1 Tax=Musa troglodytarum TaxID=320322 RepID=A0A9E7F2T3_9LILI|nr:hypothetical protein MUK42_36590 [Musa troglodytarum]
MRPDSRTLAHLPRRQLHVSKRNVSPNTNRSTDPSLSVTTAEKELHLSRCFFLLFSDLDRWLPHGNAINDRLPAYTCHCCIGCWHASLASAVLWIVSHPSVVDFVFGLDDLFPIGGASKSSAIP